MRRTSVVAPLLLIAIGGLFLARNLYPEVPLLDYLAKYWPFLLIVWGVLRLAEVLFWSATDKPLPRAGVSGGEWVLVVFLCMFGASLHAVRGFNTWWPRNVTIGGLDMFGESYDFPLDGQKPASKTPRVVLESFRGTAPSAVWTRRAPIAPTRACRLRSPATPTPSPSTIIRTACPATTCT